MMRNLLLACLVGSFLVVAQGGCTKEPDLNPPDAPVIPPGRTKENPGVPMPGKGPGVPAR